MAITMAEKDDVSPVVAPSIDEGQVALEKQMRDIGADLYLEVQQYSREELDAERKTVLRKIDWVIMPMVRTPSRQLPRSPVPDQTPDLHDLHDPVSG
jgi:hypothetical protein